MTEHRALLSVFDRGLQWFPFTNRRDEVAEVQNIFSFAFDLPHDFIVQVVDPAIIAGNRDAALLAKEIYSHAFTFKSAGIATLAIPGNEFVAEVEGCDIRVGGLPVVVEMVASAAAGDSAWVINAQSPAGEIKKMHA